MTFAGKVVLITGASAGIGRAMALEFAQVGARVGLIARRESLLREVTDAIRANGGTAEFAVADATDRSATHAAIASLTERLGPCDVLIANAGVGASNTSTDLNVPAAEAAIRTNLLGPIYAIEAVLPEMVRRGSGQLVGIASVAGLKGLPTAAAYCATKAGLLSYLESLRISLRSKGVAVTSILPGFVRTDMTAKNDKMMWVLEPDAAARKIVRAVWRRKKVYSFPRRMGALMRITRWAPDWVMARALPEQDAGKLGGGPR